MNAKCATYAYIHIAKYALYVHACMHACMYTCTLIQLRLSPNNLLREKHVLSRNLRRTIPDSYLNAKMKLGSRVDKTKGHNSTKWQHLCFKAAARCDQKVEFWAAHKLISQSTSFHRGAGFRPGGAEPNPQVTSCPAS